MRIFLSKLHLMDRYYSRASQRDRTIRSVPIMPMDDPVVLIRPLQGGGVEPLGSSPHPATFFGIADKETVKKADI